MRALVLSGGGAKGAFQVGALKHLLGDFSIHYDILTGISVGALNSSFLAMFSAGEEKDAIDGLCEIWEGVDDGRIFRQRYPLGKFLSMALSAVGSQSLYDSSPLIKLISSNLDVDRLKNSGKQLRVGAVSLKTGEYRTWGEQDEDIVRAVAASSAFPGFFNPILIDGEKWTDGGVREVVPIQDALDLGATELDVLVTSPPGLSSLNTEGLNVIEAAPRIIDAMSEEIMENDLAASYGSSAKVRILRPEKILLRNALDFSTDKIQENMELGYEMAKSRSW